MPSADERAFELVDKWLKSLELHLRYVDLSDEAYWQVQPWVHHQRPARWILDLAIGQARTLSQLLAEHRVSGDQSFAQALELMAFLANLVGAQNIERFIPLAEPERENAEVMRQAAAQTASQAAPLGATSTKSRTLVEATREMERPPPPSGASSTSGRSLLEATDEFRATDVASPKLAPRPPSPPPRAAPPRAAARTREAPVAPPEEPPPPPPAARAASTRTMPKRDARPASGKQATPAPGSAEALIVADAVRLMKWGRAWHELAESIARIAGRPGVVEVRKCLRAHKAEIERAAHE